jgi:hypothetical protein
MARTEVWARAVPQAVNVVDGVLEVHEVGTELTIRHGLTGKVEVHIEILRQLLTEAGYERKDADV